MENIGGMKLRKKENPEKNSKNSDVAHHGSSADDTDNESIWVQTNLYV